METEQTRHITPERKRNIPVPTLRAALGNVFRVIFDALLLGPTMPIYFPVAAKDTPKNDKIIFCAVSGFIWTALFVVFFGRRAFWYVVAVAVGMLIALLRA